MPNHIIQTALKEESNLKKNLSHIASLLGEKSS